MGPDASSPKLVFVISVSNDLSFSTEYVVELSNAVKDATGTPIVPTSFSITTGNDGTPPEVDSYTPTGTGVDVRVLRTVCSWVEAVIVGGIELVTTRLLLLLMMMM